MAAPAEPPPGGAAAAAPPKSDIAKALPPAEAGDRSPTVISLNRPRPTGGEMPEGLQGKKLGHFELIEPIGVGGMAAVIRAKDLQLDRIVALKILPAEMAADPENIARFKSEARAAAKLDHENIARVFFCGEDQGLHFIAFEYVEGVDLRTLLNRHGPLAPLQAVQFMLQITTGLAHAEERGVVHRDIKPSNILITPEGRAKIVDMGLARHVDPVHGAVTHSGMTLGTFDYISPEQALDPRSADIRSDIYSLGCTFYHLLTGQPPVPEGTAAKKLHHHQNVEPIDPREYNPAIPDELAAVLARMMAKEPRDRYQKPEQLIQHLIQVARKLNPSESYGDPTVLFMDAPLPKPQLFSPLLVGLAGIAAVIALAIIFGLGDQREPRSSRIPGWTSAVDNGGAAATTGAQQNSAVGPTEPAPTAAKRTAQNVDELARLLEQKVEAIVLTGEEYNLAELRAGDGVPGLLASGRNLMLSGRIEGKPAQRPLLKWKTSGERMPVPGTTQALLNLAGAGSDAVAELHHLQFDIDPVEGDAAALYGVLVQGFRRLKIVDCEFTHRGRPDATAGGSVRFESPSGREPGLLILERCLFSRGVIAVEMLNRGLVKASQCAFGPHGTLFALRDLAVRPAADVERELVEMSHCSVMQNDGTIFQVDKNVSGTIRAQDCVFARTDDAGATGETVLIRQGRSKGEVRFLGSASAAQGHNAFYRIVLWDEPGTRAATLADCRKEQLLFLDPGAVELARSPWKNARPLGLLDDNPADAFALQTTSAQLRTGPRLETALGTQRCTWGDTYAGPLPPPQDVPSELPATNLVVDPELKASDETQRHYRTLAAAVQAARPGDTILVRYTGPVDVAPMEIDGPDVRLTIQAQDGFHPVLRLAAESARLNSAMFSLFNGSLTFKSIGFRLRPGKFDKVRRSVVAISGAGHCTFQHCMATLDEAEGNRFALVALAVDPEAGVAEGDPKIRLQQCFVRGRGDVLAVRASRRFELDVEESLVVLDGSLVAVQAGPKDTPPALQAQVTCRRVTTYLSDSFLEIRAAEDRKVAGLVPMQVRCSDCLFVAAADKALIQSYGIDADTLTRQLLTWEGRGNLYGNYSKMLHVELPGAMMATMPTMPADLSPKTWLTFTRETDDSFGRVTALRAPPPDRFARAQPGDFRVKLSDMKKPEATPADFGANLVQLPQGDEE